MADNIAKRAVERTSRALLGKVFPGFGKAPGKAAEAVFSAVVRNIRPGRLWVWGGWRAAQVLETAAYHEFREKWRGRRIPRQILIS